MKIFCLTLALLVLTIGARSQNFAVLPAAVERPDEVAAGMPSNWPAVVVPVGRSTNLPPRFPSGSGWHLLSTAELEELKSTNSTAMLAYRVAQAIARQNTLTQRRTQVDDVLGGLRPILNATNAMNTTQLSLAVRRLARVIVWMVEEGRISLDPAQD